jgi:hypothetical protein
MKARSNRYWNPMIDELGDCLGGYENGYWKAGRLKHFSAKASP